MSALLEIRDLHAYYGKSHVLHGVNLIVGEGEIVSLLGRNGVGRSTTVKAVMGQVRAIGSVMFKGQQDCRPTGSRTAVWVMCLRTEIFFLR
jgi:branched-chain amino acid transport system ATP-binding protein